MNLQKIDFKNQNKHKNWYAKMIKSYLLTSYLIN